MFSHPTPNRPADVNEALLEKWGAAIIGSEAASRTVSAASVEGEHCIAPASARLLIVDDEEINVAVLSAYLQDAGYQRITSFTDPVEALLSVDEAEFDVVFLDIMMPRISGGVWIEARYDSEVEAAQLVFTIRDSGIGIPPDKLEAVFEPFVQVDNSLTRHFEGTGLGLPIARRIARSLHGDVTAASTVGVGSLFTVTIEAPLAEGSGWHDGIASDVVAAADDAVWDNAPDLRGRKVLVVEDGETNRELLREVLEEAGVGVETVEDGAQGVDRATRQVFDVILMDMQMPVMDGYTATRRLREGGALTPIIALTAHAMQGDAAKCLEAGCSDYLSKPIRAEELLRKLQSVLPRPATTEAATAPVAEEKTRHREPLRSTLPVHNPRFQAIVARFVERLDEQLSELDQALVDREFRRITELAHWLKGTGGTAGFDEFTLPAIELESRARQEQPEEVAEILNQLHELRSLIAEAPAKSVESATASHGS